MIKEVKNFDRKELFEHYHEENNPFVIITTEIDVTNVIEYCKKHKNTYATIGYLITKSVQQIDAFKYRYKEEKIYYCDTIKPNFTQMYRNGSIGYFGFEYKNEYKDFIKKFNEIQTEFLEEEKLITNNDIDEIWLSCAPWFKFTSLIPPFNKEVTIPQFIWDKYEQRENKYYINLMIMAHHGFVDGSHIGKFIETLNKNIISFKG